MRISAIASFTVAAVVFLSGCVAVPHPVVRSFADGENWVLMRPLSYDIPAAGQRGIIPQGFVTDFASIPRPLWAALPPYARYGPAAVVHDYLYWTQPCTREQADIALREAMRESRVCSVTRESIFRAVRIGGNGPWEANTRERAQGLPRVIPADRLENIPPDVTWREYRKTLLAP